MAKSPIAQVEVKLENVRLSFASIFRPKDQKYDDGTESKKYQAAFLIDAEKQTTLLDRIDDAIEEVKKAKWGDNIPKLRADKLCVRDGNDYDYDGYAGMWFVSASNSKRPVVVDKNREPLAEDDGKPYSGCYVNAIVRIWAQDNKHGKRINASLEAVQFVKDGEAFSGYKPVDAKEVFEDIDEDERDDDRGSRSRERDDDRGEDRGRGRERDDDRGRRR